MRYLIVLLLAACTFEQTRYTDMQGYIWEKRLDPIPPHRRTLELVKDGNIFLRCGLEPRAIACSVRRFRNGELWCEMFVPVDAELWVIEHEKLHCEGWTHQ